MSDLNYNTFFYYLRNNFRKLYEHASLQQWTICVPETKSLLGIQFSEEFINSHFLKQSKENTRYYTSNTSPELTYELRENNLILADKPEYIINVTSRQVGCNSEYHNYYIFILDKPLNPKFKPESSLLTIRQKTITCYDQAIEFLNTFNEHKEIVQNLKNDLANLQSFIDCDDSVFIIREMVKSKWMSILQLHSTEWQRDAHFQYLISVSLEILITQKLSDVIFPLIYLKFQKEDEIILEKCKRLCKLQISAEQFGAPEDYAVPLPAAIVELASLDFQDTPAEKLLSLRTVYDLILAEMKAAIVDAFSESIDSNIPEIPESIIIPLIMTVIIKAKPIHLSSNLYYMEHFQWTLSPNDKLWISFTAFKTALSQFLKISECDLFPKSEKIPSEMGLEKLMHITTECSERFDRNGKRINIPLSPVDRYLERVTEMITASTGELNSI